MNIPIIQGYKKPVSVVGGGGVKCQSVKANDDKGIDPNDNIRPSLLEIYETFASSSAD